MHMPSRKSGFSLVELLVVLVIISILAVVTLPAITSLTSSYNLTSGTNAFFGALNLGRQDAIALNAAVEVRFYLYQIPGFAGEPSGGSFHAYQLFEEVQASATTKPLTRVQVLPGRIIFSSSSTLSPLLTANTAVAGTLPPPGNLPSSYSYQVFNFRPDGSTSISSTTSNFVTLADSVALNAAGATTPPSNYSTIVIDTIAGTAKILRP